MQARILVTLLIIVGTIIVVASVLSITNSPMKIGQEKKSQAVPEYRSPKNVEKSVMAWIPYWDQEAAIASLKEHTDQINLIGVFWYALLRNGTIEKYPYAKIDKDLIQFAHSHNIKVLAVIANLPTEDEKGDWDSKRVQRVIASPASRQQHINDILSLLKEHNFDGVNIDYEALKQNQRDNFTTFITELATALHAENKLLGISLHPKFEEGNPSYSNGSQAQDYAALAQAADQLYVMTYEQHWETSSPGSIASVKWIKPILTFARQNIPQEKLFAGIPFYGYDWPQKGNAEGLTYQKIKERQQQHQATPQWDPNAQEWHFTYRNNGEQHEVWYNDAKTIAAKKAVLDELWIPNVAIWRIGDEDPNNWKHLP